jgi:uncharacterized repeat protein (TIGR01451 family)
MFLFSRPLAIISAGAILASAFTVTSAARPLVAVAASTLAPPVVRQADLFDVSKPLADLPPVVPKTGMEMLFEPELPDRPDAGSQPADPVRQTSGGAAMPSPNRTFEGQRDADNFPFLVEPPDPNIDVGPNDIVQLVNITMAVYGKTGTLKYGPANINTLWQGFGVGSGSPVTPVCAASNIGDPIVQYDQLADRWLISQFAFAGAAAFEPVGPYYECIAISRTGDPLGAYNRYEFLISATLFDDYPHFGVWPDAYYMSINQFDETKVFDYAGPGAVAFERAKMLAGDATARMVYFDLSGSLGTKYGGQLPTDLDGTALPPAGSPNVFSEADDDVSGFASDRLDLFKFHVDWSAPNGSTFSGPTAIPVAAFDSVFTCADADGDGVPRNCIPENGGPGLDSISDRLMYRVAYRNIGGHEALVLNHTVDVNDPAGHAGIRWYELRQTSSSAWSIYQQGTYAPDANHRWMGSIAMDKAGDVALGFSISSASTYPSIAYAGRLNSDALGQLGQGEASMFQGTGSEDADGGGRWGDYTSLVLDPVNDCTFWYTNEYYVTTTSFDWHTRLGSFTFPNCLGAGADLGVSTTVNPPPVKVGDTLTYGVTVSNNGPSSTPGVMLVDALPSQASFLSAVPSQGKCSGTATVTCRLGSLGKGAKATVTIKARAPATAATLTNTATVSGNKADPNPDNNVAVTTVSVVDPCTLPGVLVSTDTSDDAPNVSPVPETDIKALYVAEPHQADGAGRLVFTVKVGASTSPTPPPSSQWYVLWNRTTPDATFDRYYVAMKTDAAGQVSFEYGGIAPPSLNTPTRLGAADAGAYDPASGTISITISNAKIDGVAAGSALASLQVRTFLTRADGGPVTQLQATDFGPIELYTLAGNC